MPISCDLDIRPLGREAFGQFSYRIMRHVFACQNQIGRLADESIYQQDVFERLRLAGLKGVREVPVLVSFRNFCKRYLLDLVVADCVVCEFKTVSELTPAHEAQLMNYLLLLDLKHGLLVNFRPEKVRSLFVNAPVSRIERQDFSVQQNAWSGGVALLTLVVEMLRDWGTGLSLPLYHQAIVHLLGGEDCVGNMLPIARNGKLIGNQRFYLTDAESAFRVSAFPDVTDAYQLHLKLLLSHSPLKAIHWINISLREVTFVTVR